jgi:hypothetical protein
VRALVHRRGNRGISHLIVHIGDSLQKIDIFKPHWTKPFVEAAEPLPDIAAHHQKRTCGLLHVGGSVRIEVEAAVAPIYRISRDQAVQPKRLERERCRNRQTPHHESLLWTALRVNKFPCRGRDIFYTALGFECVEAGHQHRIGIEQ